MEEKRIRHPLEIKDKEARQAYIQDLNTADEARKNADRRVYLDRCERELRVNLTKGRITQEMFDTGMAEVKSQREKIQ